MMTGICSYCGRIFSKDDITSTVCRTMHRDEWGGRHTCDKEFCSGDCYERHLMETEGRR